ncbi:MAG: hypothetical protein IJM30_02500 [Thermoguttaceae bacterium]|nr:hypothetical protein [Thermoguttaceae bacterium]
MKRERKLRFPRRKGAVPLDYVLVLIVTLPLSWALFCLLTRALRDFYYFSSISLGWLIN